MADDDSLRAQLDRLTPDQLEHIRSTSFENIARADKPDLVSALLAADRPALLSTLPTVDLGLGRPPSSPSRPSPSPSRRASPLPHFRRPTSLLSSHSAFSSFSGTATPAPATTTVSTLAGGVLLPESDGSASYQPSRINSLLASSTDSSPPSEAPFAQSDAGSSDGGDGQDEERDEREGEDARALLRAQLKRSRTASAEGRLPRRRGKGKLPADADADAASVVSAASDASSERRYFVLTSAGKPVFTSQEVNEDDDTTSAMGVMQALISIFADDDDKIRSIKAGSLRITFLLRAPLYYVCVSTLGEPESVSRLHLEYLHLQILSVVSSAQLHRIFSKRSNFDLRRLLEGTEGFLRSLLVRLRDDFSILLAGLQPLRMEPGLRQSVGESLLPPKEIRANLLYVILLSHGKVVTLLRPRKHSIHPSDLHLLLNTVLSSTSLRTSESWLPICLPRLDSSSFVHTYVAFETTLPDVGLVCVSKDREGFFALSGWWREVAETLREKGVMEGLDKAGETQAYGLGDVAVPGLRHFVYKSRQNMQVTSPSFEAPYDEKSSQRRLLHLYQHLHYALHARSPSTTFHYIRTEEEAALGWLTQPFEVYIALPGGMPKSAAVAAANGVVRWVRREEARLFLGNAPVF